MWESVRESRVQRTAADSNKHIKATIIRPN